MHGIGRPSNRHGAYWAFVVHRVSGLLLALFLPVHFWALGLAIKNEAALDGMLRWAESPLVKLAEFVLVFLLAAHLTGGLRLLAIEFLPWSGRQAAMLSAAGGIAFAAAVLFLLNAV
ncbi:MAG: succinate dehydrogenase, cytochrome b556 subunit [Gammaproteobacteria bacterium]|nr:succinate dehydrogenase, cytochrome b556 subunit [Gammaproteobacteria bacterium]